MPAMTRTEALARYANAVGPVNRDRNVAIVRRYLEHGGTAQAVDLQAYVRALQRAGKKPATVAKEIAVIRSFWRHLGIAPARVAVAFNAQQDSTRISLSREVIDQWITAAHDPASALSAYQRALIVLAATYGPRAEELAAIQPQDVDTAHARIYWRTAKHGRPCWQWLPPALHPAVDIPWPAVTTAHVSRQFGRIWSIVCATEKPPGAGWHSIRRALVRDLCEAGVPAEAVDHFLRWKVGGRSATPRDLYAHPTQTAGRSGLQVTARSSEGSRDEDGAVWERHPSASGTPQVRVCESANSAGTW